MRTVKKEDSSSRNIDRHLTGTVSRLEYVKRVSLNLLPIFKISDKPVQLIRKKKNKKIFFTYLNIHKCIQIVLSL